MRRQQISTNTFSEGFSDSVNKLTASPYQLVLLRQICNSLLQSDRVVFEISQPCIAMRTQQASNVLGEMAMVNDQTSDCAQYTLFATNSTPKVLAFSHFLHLSQRQPITAFILTIFAAVGVFVEVFLQVLFAVLSFIWTIVKCFIACIFTHSANIQIAAFGGFRANKVCNRLGLATFIALLVYTRFSHVVYSLLVNNSIRVVQSLRFVQPVFILT